MGDPLFRRLARVTIHRLVLEGLSIEFEIERSLKREPNTAEVRIRNLSAQHRAQLQEQGTVTIKLEAGYVPRALSADTQQALQGAGVTAGDGLALIFAGDLRRAYSAREGADWVTVITSGDGERATRQARVKLSFRPGVRWAQILSDLAKETGLDVGNALTQIEGTALLRAPTSSQITVTGTALQQMQSLSQSFGLETSVQDGALQVLPLGAPLAAQAVELSPDTGLIGSPEPASDGGVRFRSLINPDLQPGRRVKLAAAHVSGDYRLRRIRFNGDTSGGPWYADCEGSAL